MSKQLGIFGRFSPGDSPIHRLDPRTKLVLALVLIITGLCVQSWPAIGIYALIIIGLYLIARIPPKTALTSIAPLLFIVIITMLLNLLFTNTGEIYAHWGPFTISARGVHLCLFMGARLTLLIAAACLLMLTTSSLDITDATENLLSPLERWGFPTHALAMMTGIALRFLPIFAQEFTGYRQALMARCAQIDRGSLGKRLASNARLIVPLCKSAFRHAETLSTAMECRCYNGGIERTHLRELRLTRADYCAVGICIMLVATTIVAGIL